jgi:ribosomal protein L11 methyltransferase
VLRLALRVRRADAEVALAELLELAPGGVEERDLGETIEYAVYGAPGELPALPALRAAAGGALVEISTSELADDWAERWREFHSPVVVGERLHVRPSWTPAPGAHVIDVVIDPAQAFGTGAHATTRLCLELMLDLDPAGSFADVGCGSGVLGIAAAKLGWAPVVAVDSDPLSVEATLANAAVNGVEVTAARADLRAEPTPGASTVAANLLRPLLLAFAERLAVPPPTTLIAGGLLRGEADEVAAAFGRHGLSESARREAGDWAAVLLRRS